MDEYERKLFQRIRQFHKDMKTLVEVGNLGRCDLLYHQFNMLVQQSTQPLRFPPSWLKLEAENLPADVILIQILLVLSGQLMALYESEFEASVSVTPIETA